MGCYGGSLGMGTRRFATISYVPIWSVFRSGRRNPYYAPCNGGQSLVNLGRLPRPSDTSLFWDGWLSCCFSPMLHNPSEVPRHQEGLNICYADGPARYHKSYQRPDLTHQWFIRGGPYDGRNRATGIPLPGGQMDEVILLAPAGDPLNWNPNYP